MSRIERESALQRATFNRSWGKDPPCCHNVQDIRPLSYNYIIKVTGFEPISRGPKPRTLPSWAIPWKESIWEKNKRFNLLLILFIRLIQNQTIGFAPTTSRAMPGTLLIELRLILVFPSCHPDCLFTEGWSPKFEAKWTQKGLEPSVSSVQARRITNYATGP